MIHSANPPVPQIVVNVIFVILLEDLLIFESVEGQTDGLCEKIISTGHDLESAKWINKKNRKSL